MKSMKLLFTVLFVAVATIAFGQNITGSAHDFSADAWNYTDTIWTGASNGEICAVCHAPHNSTNTTDSILWSRATSLATYKMYDSPTLNGTSSTISGVSKLCLSCHDGTVALSDFGGVTGYSTTKATGVANLGSDLSNDHPVSITYDATAGLGMEATSNVFGASTLKVSDVLVGNKVECSSCHDVHNADNVKFLLRHSNAKSELCLGCHDK